MSILGPSPLHILQIHPVECGDSFCKSVECEQGSLSSYWHILQISVSHGRVSRTTHTSSLHILQWQIHSLPQVAKGTSSDCYNCSHCSGPWIICRVWRFWDKWCGPFTPVSGSNSNLLPEKICDPPNFFSAFFFLNSVLVFSFLGQWRFINPQRVRARFGSQKGVLKWIHTKIGWNWKNI